MEQPQKLQLVQIISTKFMKPTSPTPTTHKLFTLSSLDQISPLKHFPILFCYINSTNQPFDINALELPLRETLTQFYPLAGRCNDGSTLHCNDQGIPLIETRVNSSLSDILDSTHRLDLLAKLLPSRELYMSYGQLHNSEVVHIAIQVNVFLCGGVVIGCYLLHKLLDATSAGIFFNYWATLARGKCSTINLGQIQPDFAAAVKAFPPEPLPENGGSGGDGATSIASRLAQVKSIQVVGKSFVFSNAVIKKMKAKATNSHNLPNPTSFEAVMGFIWHHIFAAACTAATLPSDNSGPGHGHGPTSLLFKANIRAKHHPILPNTSIGNLTKSVHVRVNKLHEFPDLATEIHRAVSEMKENLVGSLPEINPFANHGYKFGSYLVSSWCRLGFSEVDFGFGKPSRIVPVGMVHPFLRNMVMLVDYMDHSGVNGIEAWLFLEDKEMQVLESNPQFRVFASSN